MKAKFIAFLAVATLTLCARAVPTTWTFETSIPTTAGPHAAEFGSGFASGYHASASTAYSNPVGNGSGESFSSTAWSVGDYYQFALSSAGFKDIKVSWDQASSSTGPRDFGFFWSSDGVAYTQFGANYIVNGTVSPNPSWTSSTYYSLYSYSLDLSSLTVLNDAAVISFRLVMMSNVSASGGTVASGGTDRVDNFKVDMTRIPSGAVPDTGTTAWLLAIPLLGLWTLRRLFPGVA